MFWKPCSSFRSFHLLREEFLLAPIHSPLSGSPYRSFKGGVDLVEVELGLFCPHVVDSPVGARGRSARSRLTECSSCSSRVLVSSCFDLPIREEGADSPWVAEGPQVGGGQFDFRGVLLKVWVLF
jgi:hypothetical protein